MLQLNILRGAAADCRMVFEMLKARYVSFGGYDLGDEKMGLRNQSVYLSQARGGHPDSPVRHCQRLETRHTRLPGRYAVADYHEHVK